MVPKVCHLGHCHAEVERSQNTVPLASTQAVYKAPHSTVQHAHSDAETHTHRVRQAAVAVAVGSLRA